MPTMNAFKRIISKNGSVFLVLLTLTFGIYHSVFLTFYQQDEWQSLGHNMVEGWRGILAYMSPIQLFFAEGRLLGRFFYFLFLRNYTQGVVPIFALGILAHALNAYLVFLLVKKLKGSVVGRWAAALFFIANSVADQSVLWASAVITVFATTMLLVSLLLYGEFLEKKDLRKRNLAFLIGILSLFMKETGLFIFLFYPLVYAWWHKTRNIKKILMAHLPLLIYGICMVLFRIVELIWGPHYAGFVDGTGTGFLFPLVYHSAAYPLTSFFQVFIPPADIYTHIAMVARSEYPYLIDSPLINLVAQSAVADAVSFMGTIFLSGAIAVMISLDKKRKKTSMLLVWGCLIFVLSFLPYAVLHKSFSYLSARYYYVGVLGAALVFGYMVTWMMARLPKVGKIILAILLLLYGAHHVQAIWADIQLQVVQSLDRKAFLGEVTRVVSKPEKKTVFYITSDKKYVGETTYPFQNGLGYILEVLYYKTGNIPKEFLASDFLWDLGSEGYKEVGPYGFGYFEHRDQLEAVVQSRKVDPSIVHGYLYNSATNHMTDITPQLREQLATFSGTLP